MKISQGSAVLITGAGSGIGKAVALEFAKQGAHVTIVDIQETEGQAVADQINEAKQVSNEGSGGERPAAIFVKTDVSKSDQLANAFLKHMEVFGRLDVCFNNAGICEKGFFTDEGNEWRKLLAINLEAVIEGTQLAIRHMRGFRTPGVIVNTASVAGLHPTPEFPIYSAAKGGVVLFTRALAGLAKEGIRVNAICPEIIDTPLVEAAVAKEAMPEALRLMGGFIPMETVVEAVMELVEDESKSGACIWISNRKGKQVYPPQSAIDEFIEGMGGVPPNKDQVF
eukprot:jgi/Mesen1/10289/ME000079S09705